MITSFQISPAGFGRWLLTWTSDLTDPTYRLYRDGVLIVTTSVEEFEIGLQPGELPVFEILDDDTEEPTPAYPDHLTLAWYGATGVDYYRIDQYVSAVWTERAKVTDAGQGYFVWTSARLADGETHQFRVVPVGTNGNAGTAVTFAALVVRYPDAPEVTYTYDAGTGVVTIAAV